MAILDTLPGVEVTVTVEDEPLEEHADNDLTDDSFTVTRYVEAKSNQIFAVKILTKKGATRGAGLSYQVHVDGTETFRRCVTFEDVQKDDYLWNNKGRDAGGAGGSDIQKYKFTALNWNNGKLASKLSQPGPE